MGLFIWKLQDWISVHLFSNKITTTALCIIIYAYYYIMDIFGENFWYLYLFEFWPLKPMLSLMFSSKILVWGRGCFLLYACKLWWVKRKRCYILKIFIFYFCKIISSSSDQMIYILSKNCNRLPRMTAEKFTVSLHHFLRTDKQTFKMVK